MTPLDIMLWALAGVIAIAALLFIVMVAWMISSIVRSMLRKRTLAEPGDTYVFTGKPIEQTAEQIAAEIAKARNRQGES